MIFRFPKKWFATGEAIAHLRYLEEKQAITRHRNDRVVTFLLN